MGFRDTILEMIGRDNPRVTNTTRPYCLAQHSKDLRDGQERELDCVPEGDEDNQVQPSGSTGRRPCREEVSPDDQRRCQ
ncbi:hypothetical protein CF8_2342 [Nocardioides sp. CF8]|nr:hypothetical protein CF8_2342 [Nocardioides sp. CF8]